MSAQLSLFGKSFLGVCQCGVEVVVDVALPDERDDVGNALPYQLGIASVVKTSLISNFAIRSNYAAKLGKEIKKAPFRALFD